MPDLLAACWAYQVTRWVVSRYSVLTLGMTPLHLPSQLHQILLHADVTLSHPFILDLWASMLKWEASRVKSFKSVVAVKEFDPKRFAAHSQQTHYALWLSCPSLYDNHAVISAPKRPASALDTSAATSSAEKKQKSSLPASSSTSASTATIASPLSAVVRPWNVPLSVKQIRANRERRATAALLAGGGNPLTENDDPIMPSLAEPVSTAALPLTKGGSPPDPAAVARPTAHNAAAASGSAPAPKASVASTAPASSIPLYNAVCQLAQPRRGGLALPPTTNHAIDSAINSAALTVTYSPEGRLCLVVEGQGTAVIEKLLLQEEEPTLAEKLEAFLTLSLPSGVAPRALCDSNHPSPYGAFTPRKPAPKAVGKTKTQEKGKGKAKIGNLGQFLYLSSDSDAGPAGDVGESKAALLSDSDVGARASAQYTSDESESDSDNSDAEGAATTNPPLANHAPSPQDAPLDGIESAEVAALETALDAALDIEEQGDNGLIRYSDYENVKIAQDGLDAWLMENVEKKPPCTVITDLRAHLSAGHEPGLYFDVEIDGINQLVTTWLPGDDDHEIKLSLGNVHRIHQSAVSFSIFRRLCTSFNLADTLESSGHVDVPTEWDYHCDPRSSYQYVCRKSLFPHFHFDSRLHRGHAQEYATDGILGSVSCVF